MTWPGAAPDVPVSSDGQSLATLGGAASSGHVTHHNKIRTAIIEITGMLGLTGGFKVPVKLAESVLVASAASISFQSIPPGYRSLMLQFALRCDAAGASAVVMRFNNDSTAAHYMWQMAAGNISTGASFNNLSDTAIYFVDCTRPAMAANQFSGGIIHIYDYSATNKFKNSVGVSGMPGVEIYSSFGTWLSTAGINRVDFALTAGNFIAGSSVTLWGMPT